jgi:hypothetical protein
VLAACLGAFPCSLRVSPLVAQVEQMNKDFQANKISKTELIQRKLACVDQHLGGMGQTA